MPWQNSWFQLAIFSVLFAGGLLVADLTSGSHPREQENPPPPLTAPPSSVTTPASQATVPPVPAPPVNPAASNTPAVSGVWYLKVTIVNLPGVTTMSFNPNGSWKMETVLSDNGTFHIGGGTWSMVSKVSGVPQKGAYRVLGPGTIELSGPFGPMEWTLGQPGLPLNSYNPNLIGTWRTTLRPQNLPPWQMTMTHPADDTYSTRTDIVDEGTWTQGTGQVVMQSQVTGGSYQVTYRSLGQDSMEFTGPTGPATWSRNRP